MKKRIQIYVLVGLLVALAYVLATSHGEGSGTNGVLASDANFVPLNVDEPELRLDLLANLKKLEYTGIHRDIFSAVALPPPPAPGSENAKRRHPYPTVPEPAPPPPVQVPGTLYGYAQMKDSGKRVAFFQEGEDVLVVQEGAEFLHGYRLIKINDNSADVVEISSGRHANVPMTPPLNGADAGPGGNNP
ncbi:MAG: hypothetical protein WA823_19590 [Candidatus Acidiferrales bacterium]